MKLNIYANKETDEKCNTKRRKWKQCITEVALLGKALIFFACQSPVSTHPSNPGSPFSAG